MTTTRILATLLVIPVLCAVAAAATDPDPAALVREVRQTESWIDRVKSLHLRVEGTWKMPKEGIEHRVAELKKRFPGTQPTTQTFPELNPEGHDTIEIAFDQKRAAYRVLNPASHMPIDHRVWDGKQAIDHEKYVNDELFALDSKPGQFLDTLMLWLPWPRAGVHAFWWTDPDRRVDEDFIGGKPEVIALKGREVFRGVECYVLDSPMYWHRLYVGVADHRLYGNNNRVMPRSAKSADGIMFEIAKAHGKQLNSIEEYNLWQRAQPKEVQDQLNLEYFRRLEPLSRPYIDNWFADYQEIAPGCWMPMRMGYDFWEPEGSKPFIESHRELKVIEAAVDQPLPEELFKIEFKEGVQVNDWGHKPPLLYKYKKDRTPAEWQAIIDEANKRQADQDQREAAQDKLIGQPAPAFPEKAEWLNSPPLDWAKLNGKVVILACWAEWCGPCRNEFPALAELAKEKDGGIVVIGLHPPGSERAAIEKILNQFDMHYPVCVDAAPAGGDQPSSWGQMGTALANTQLPDTYVVDRHGKIAGHGSLGKTLGLARTLATAPASTAPSQTGAQAK